MGSPRETPGTWDAVDIGGVILPPAGVDGHVIVTVKPKIKDDKKSPAGKNGGRNTTQGLDLAEGEIELEWPDAPGQYDLVEAAVGELWPPQGAKGITHSATRLWGVRDIEIRSAQGPEWKDGKGSIKLAWREWRPPPVAIAGGGGGAGESIELKKLRIQIAIGEQQLAALKAENIKNPAQIAAAEQRLNEMKAQAANFGSSATKTSTSSTPGGTWSQGSGNGTPALPLGEIQP